MSMSSARSQKNEEPMMEMNMTPLIDVMLVLIIMFIITIPIQNHSTNVNLPNGAAQKPLQDPKIMDLTIDFDGTVYWNKQIINASTLEANLAGVAAEKDQAEVHLRAHKLAKYHYVAKVMASAQRLGVNKLGMVGNEQFL